MQDLSVVCMHNRISDFTTLEYFWMLGVDILWIQIAMIAN